MASALTGMDSLPSKDVALFKSTLKYYEYKQYKKGLKVCDTLLKRHPEHGESLAMKGLFLSNLNKKEDGYEHVRLGLKYCLRSHVCWHVYGLLYRADKNYDEAIKCYRNALRFDKDNGQILRELAVLQLQTRQYSALVETRYQLLTLRPVVKLNWVSLAVAYHLGGQHDQAVGVLEAIFDGFPVESDTRAYQIEQSELIFYKSFILEESGRYEEAYKALDRSNFSIVDSVEWGKRRAGLMMKMNMIEEAQRMWEELFDLNPDSKATLAKLLDCTRTDNFTSLSQLAQKYPHSLLLKSELIRCAPKEQLLHVLSNLIIPMVKRGIPNAFSILRNLYHSEENIHVIRQMISSLEEGTSADSTDLESAAWTHVLIAQHYSIVDSSPESAIKHMESAVSLNPNVPEIFFQYAKILRRLGNLEKAANCMDYARRLDLSDRFLNSKAVKYFLRAGRIEEAKEMAVLFVKKGEIDTRLQDLVEMQVLWYAREMGRAYQAAGNHTEALIYFNQCRKHFEDFYDDQFDFHNYVLRRMTLCSYIKLLRYEDVIAGHCEFLETAELAIRSLLYLKDHGEAAIQEGLEGLHFGEVDCKAADSKMGGYLADALIWAEKLLTFRGNDPRAHRIASPVLWQCGKLLPACRSAILASAEGISPEFVKSLLNDLSNSTTIEMELARDILGRVKVENLKVPRCSLDLPTPNLDKFL